MGRVHFFDEVARGGNPLLFSDEDHAKMIRLKARLGDLRGLRVMEPGCGAGPLTKYLSRWVGGTGEVFAFDASPAMVEVCRRRTAGCNNVRVVRAVLGDMSLEADAWDLIVLFRVLPHLDNPRSILCALRNALKPAGRLVIANLESSEAVNRWHAQCGGPVGRDYMPSADELAAMLEQCGFAIRDIEDAQDGFWALAYRSESMAAIPAKTQR